MFKIEYKDISILFIYYLDNKMFDTPVCVKFIESIGLTRIIDDQNGIWYIDVCLFKNDDNIILDENGSEYLYSRTGEYIISGKDLYVLFSPMKVLNLKSRISTQIKTTNGPYLFVADFLNNSAAFKSETRGDYLIILEYGTIEAAPSISCDKIEVLGNTIINYQDKRAYHIKAPKGYPVDLRADFITNIQAPYADCEFINFNVNLYAADKVFSGFNSLSITSNGTYITLINRDIIKVNVSSISDKDAPLRDRGLVYLKEGAIRYVPLKNKSLILLRIPGGNCPYYGYDCYSCISKYYLAEIAPNLINYMEERNDLLYDICMMDGTIKTAYVAPRGNYFNMISLCGEFSVNLMDISDMVEYSTYYDSDLREMLITLKKCDESKPVVTIDRDNNVFVKYEKISPLIRQIYKIGGEYYSISTGRVKKFLCLAGAYYEHLVKLCGLTYLVDNEGRYIAVHNADQCTKIHEFRLDFYPQSVKLIIGNRFKILPPNSATVYIFNAHYILTEPDIFELIDFEYEESSIKSVLDRPIILSQIRGVKKVNEIISMHDRFGCSIIFINSARCVNFVALDDWSAEITFSDEAPIICHIRDMNIINRMGEVICNFTALIEEISLPNPYKIIGLRNWPTIDIETSILISDELPEILLEETIKPKYLRVYKSATDNYIIRSDKEITRGQKRRQAVNTKAAARLAVNL